MSIRLTICQTCKRPDEMSDDVSGQTHGQVLTAHIAALAQAREQDVELIRQECLWACRRSCTILIKSVGKFGYIAGDFSANTSAAEAILDWCAKMAAASDGKVAFREWPEGMKGKFIARIPPANENAEPQIGGTSHE